MKEQSTLQKQEKIKKEIKRYKKHVKLAVLQIQVLQERFRSFEMGKDHFNEIIDDFYKINQALFAFLEDDFEGLSL